MGAPLLGARPLLQIGGKVFTAPELWDWATEVINSGGTFIISASDPITPDYKSTGTDEQGNPSFFESVRNTVPRRKIDIASEPFPASGTWYLYALRRGYENTLPFDRDDEDNFFRVYSPTRTTYALIQFNVGSLTEAACPMFPVHGSSWHRSEWVAAAAFVAAVATVGVASAGVSFGAASGTVGDVVASGGVGSAGFVGPLETVATVVDAAPAFVGPLEAATPWTLADVAAAPAFVGPLEAPAVVATTTPWTFSSVLSGVKTATGTVKTVLTAAATIQAAVGGGGSANVKPPADATPTGDTPKPQTNHAMMIGAGLLLLLMVQK